MRLKILPGMGRVSPAPLALAAIALVSMAAVSAAQGQSLEPFESPRISETQWRTYYFEVESAHRDSLERMDDELLIQFRDTGSAIIWTFTQFGHPAHPGWVARQVVNTAGNTSIRQVGYFAGDEDAFVILFQKFLEHNKSIQERMNQ